jgi:uncharacterized membrane protein
MKPQVAAFATAVAVILAMDAVWLGILAGPFYQRSIGHLMAAQPNLVAALAFYPVYALGLIGLVVAPLANEAGPQRTLARAALLGLAAYGTYDISNLATLRDWPVTVTLVDIAWGCLVTVTAAVASRAAWRRFARHGAPGGDPRS